MTKGTSRRRRALSRLESRALPKLPDRSNRLAKDVLRMPLHDVILQFSHRLVAEPLVERLCPRIEGRDAEEDVWRLAEDPLLGESHQPGPDPPAPVFLADADRLDVSDEGARHVQDHETEHAVSFERPVHLARRVLQQGERFLVSALERDPRLGAGHHSRAHARLLRRSQRTDVEGGHRRLFDDREDLAVPALAERSQLKDVPNHDHESLLLLPDFFTLCAPPRRTPRVRPIGSRAQKTKSVAGGSAPADRSSIAI